MASRYSPDCLTLLGQTAQRRRGFGSRPSSQRYLRRLQDTARALETQNERIKCGRAVARAIVTPGCWAGIHSVVLEASTSSNRRAAASLPSCRAGQRAHAPRPQPSQSASAGRPGSRPTLRCRRVRANIKATSVYIHASTGGGCGFGVPSRPWLEHRR